MDKSKCIACKILEQNSPKLGLAEIKKIRIHA